GRSARDLRRQQAQGVPKARKKAGFAPTGAVCRSCTTLPVSTGASPTRRGNRNGFPESQVFGAGTLPVGVQGRSAQLAATSSEIPEWVMIIAENRGNGRFRAFLLEYGNGRG
ncbi:hypothetical protein, partial [Victivallis vadensis]|uniref:hypothetical protein n=1 Tax=Victivallis vadensis TaxID=172901 RepID=UPI00307EF9E8